LVGLEEFSMRAIPSQHRRRGLAAGLVMTSVIALSILGGGTALAANPTWNVGFGPDSSVAAPSGASQSTVSAGQQVIFSEWMRNDDTSNISQLFLTSKASAPATVVSASWIITSSSGSTVRTGTCPAVTPLACTFGALNSGNSVAFSALYNVGSGIADGTVLTMTYEFNTTGTPPGKNNSHGDAKQILDKVTVAKNDDAAGDYNFDGQQGSTTVSDVTKLTGKNTQGTSASVFASLVGVAVGDSPTLSTPCDPSFFDPGTPVPQGFSCDTSLTSLTSTVEVGNGKTFKNALNGPGIKVLINFTKSPDQLGGANPFVYHYYQTYSFASDGSVVATPHAEFVAAPCTIGAGGVPTNTTPCLIVGTKQVTAWVFHNGNMRS
jgi:hypothetical protein